MKPRRILLGAGWKMNKTVGEAEDYVRRLHALLSGMAGIDHIQLFLVPPFTAIAAVKRLSAGRFLVGAQNMHWEESGAYTGEISALMLRELNVDLVEIGHAERRHFFNETDDSVARKIQAALTHGLRPLLCIGESAEDHQAGVARETIARQLKIALRSVRANHASAIMLAYEPVWAIGEEGTVAPADYVRGVNSHIRGVLEDIFGAAAAAIPVLYGGTVDGDNCRELLDEGRPDGLFVGRAAWSPEGFARLIAACAVEEEGGPSGDRYEQEAHSS